MDVPLTASKVCTVCGNELPLDCFRLRRATGSARETRCRRCFAAYMREYRRRKRSAALRTFAAAVAKESSFRRVERLVEQMVSRLGGVAALTKLWAGEIKAAGATGPGKARAIKAMLAIANMQSMVATNAPPDPFAELTHDQVREVMRYKLEDLLRHKPAGDRT